MKICTRLTGIAVLFALASHSQSAGAQGYGTDLQNVMAPASGGMAGVSAARPQDVPSAIFGNPATLAQFHGTQFTMGGSWVEGYPSISYDGGDPTIGPTPFTVTSRTEGFTGSEIGVTHDLRPLGFRGTMGMGLAGLSGVGAEYRGLVPESPNLLNNLSEEYLVLGVNLGAGFELTDRFAVGATVTLGTGFEELGNVGPIVSSAMVHSYALRGTVGATYEVNDCNTLGFYYQSPMDFTFPDAVRVSSIGGGSSYHDIRVGQPNTFGLGVANRSLMGGDLLIAFDVYYKLWDQAPLWQDVLTNQWAFAVGAQLTREDMKYRLGYSFNGNPINHNVGTQLDGIGIGQDLVQLYQAAAVPLVNQHRITGGIGRQNLLFPGMDLDLFGGGMLPESGRFGTHSTTSLGLYYVGVGLTWRYDAARHAEVPDSYDRPMN
jgi:long-chain fatty acid transport protein